MKTILNKTARPIRVPLPLGKTLHLGGRQKGEISPKAVTHPPLVKLVESGDLEIIGDGSHTDPRQAATGSIRDSNRGGHPAVSNQRRGDR